MGTIILAAVKAVLILPALLFWWVLLYIASQVMEPAAVAWAGGISGTLIGGAAWSVYRDVRKRRKTAR